MNVSNIPNLLTLFRFVVTPLVILLLLTDAPWAGVVTAVLVSLAGLSDFLDGYLARYLKSETNVGKFLDPLADKVLVVAGLIMLIGLGRIHPILVVIIICREIFITGLRAIASSKGIVIAAEKSAKYKTTF
ncbi:MAG: CDP-diacylglycerol--glycerol-3-phosphate 3-phosphatidyltransferase, partial [Deltaproteobacteria bacterium]|nr:CDP-diacylglycerol--glycerol-3-phosphate 3-phosphatidyltransferase [Deltaproteobacteria bacterium]